MLGMHLIMGYGYYKLFYAIREKKYVIVVHRLRGTVFFVPVYSHELGLFTSILCSLIADVELYNTTVNWPARRSGLASTSPLSSKPRRTGTKFVDTLPIRLARRNCLELISRFTIATGMIFAVADHRSFCGYRDTTMLDVACGY